MTTHNHTHDAGTAVQAGTVHGSVHVHAATPEVPVPRQLPPRPRLVGRAEELARLHALHDRPRSEVPVLVVTGLAGAGVSAVATEWAHQVAEAYPDGQVVLDFSTGLPPGDALGAALRAVGCRRPPVTAFERVGLWRTLTRKRRLLVLADGASTADQLRPLLPAGPGSLLLATTRRSLPELALNGAHTVDVGPLADTDAADLLAASSTSPPHTRKTGSRPRSRRAAGCRSR